MAKKRAPRKRTLTIDQNEINRLKKKLLHISNPVSSSEVVGRTIQQDLFRSIRLSTKKISRSLVLSKTEWEANTKGPHTSGQIWGFGWH